MSPRHRTLAPFLLLLFAGTFSNSVIVPYMGFFLVDGLGQPPWMLSLYAGVAVSLTVSLNRLFGRRIDGGARVFPLVGVALAGYGTASLALTLSPSLPIVLSLGVLGYGLSATAISGMFALGGHLAEAQGVPRATFNAWMRATTSLAWMIGPAVSFSAAGWLGPETVFHIACVCTPVWGLAWLRGLPRDVTAPAPSKPTAQTGPIIPGLGLAAAFILCLSLAHGLTFSALPLFFVQEVGLPDFAPGLAFSVKTFVEVIAIFATPALMAAFGLRWPLLACTALAILAIQMLAGVQSLPQMMLGSALEGLYYGLYASLGISYIQSFAPARPAQATALYWNALMISGLLAGPAVGLIAQISRFETVLHIASGVALLAMAVLALGALRASGPKPSP